MRGEPAFAPLTTLADTPESKRSMRTILRTLAVSTLAFSLTSGAALSQEHHDDQARQDQARHGQEHHGQYVHHDDWKRGHRMNHEDWDRGERVDDWQAHHLRRPPRGHEWREVDGQYVLADPNGVIFQVVVPH